MKEIHLVLFIAYCSLASSDVPHTHGAPLQKHDPFHFPYFPSLSNFFGGSGFPHTNTIPHSHDSSGYFNHVHDHDHFHGHRRSRVVCPEELEDPYIATYSSNLTLYPLNAIALELAQPVNANLLTCLTVNAILPDVPQFPPSPILVNSTAACDYSLNRLASFDKYGGRCWLLQTIQENIFFARCSITAQPCKTCQLSYGYGHGYGYGYQANAKKCLHTYRFESVWAYCEARAVNTRIVRERIVVPDSCTCRSVQCKTVHK